MRRLLDLSDDEELVELVASTAISVESWKGPCSQYLDSAIEDLCDMSIVRWWGVCVLFSHVLESHMSILAKRIQIPCVGHSRT